MAKRINVIKAYTPIIDLLPTVKSDHLIDYLSGRSNLSQGTVDHLLYELRDALVFFGRMGQPVKLQGIGTFTPTMALDGTVSMTYLPSTDIKNRLNHGTKFSGDIKNKDMVGKTIDDLVDRWNLEHPDDPVVD